MSAARRTRGGLRSCEFEQRGVVLLICGLESRDVPVPGISGSRQVLTSPGEPRSLQYVLQQNVCHQSGVTTIAIGKGVDRDEPVVKSDSNLIR
jgi:hypothetical protein